MTRARRALASAFIASQLASILVVAVPSPLRDGAARALEPGMRWLGTWQDWRMFAPEPHTADRALLITVSDADGVARRTWRLPRDDAGRHARRRDVKFTDNLRRAVSRPALADVARYFARQAAAEGLPAVRVRIDCETTAVAPPAPGAWQPLAPPPGPVTREVLAELPVAGPE